MMSCWCQHWTRTGVIVVNCSVYWQTQSTEVKETSKVEKIVTTNIVSLLKTSTFDPIASICLVEMKEGNTNHSADVSGMRHAVHSTNRLQFTFISTIELVCQPFGNLASSKSGNKILFLDAVPSVTNFRLCHTINIAYVETLNFILPSFLNFLGPMTSIHITCIRLLQINFQGPCEDREQIHTQQRKPQRWWWCHCEFLWWRWITYML